MERKFRIGLRQGENEIVLKVVYGGGQGGGRLSPVIIGVGGPVMASGPGGSGSFSFNLTPEGDDVFTHEVATILRQEALDCAARGPRHDRGSRSTGDGDPGTGGREGQVAPLKDGKPKKVSLVGEKSRRSGATERRTSSRRRSPRESPPRVLPLAHRPRRPCHRRGTRQAQGRGEGSQAADARDARHGGAREAAAGVHLPPWPVQEPRRERGPRDARRCCRRCRPSCRATGWGSRSGSFPANTR